MGCEMETRTINSAVGLSSALQRAAKVALAVGAACRISADGEQLLAQFKESDSYYFDPENITLHMLEALGEARMHGFITPNIKREPETETTSVDVLVGWARFPFVIRTVYSVGDVRVQIGDSRWYVDTHTNTAHAMRRAIVSAFCAYYDEAIAPYTEA